jgi:hypothetical protein
MGEMGRACSTRGKKRNACKFFVGEPEGKTPLGRYGSRVENNTKMNLTETGLRDMDWINLVQDRHQLWALANTVMNLRVPYNVRKLISS